MNIMPTRKGQMIGSACTQCRRSKTKCSGDRPACTRCSARRDDCIYEVEEGRTRQQDLHIRLQQKDEQIIAMKGVLQKLQRGSDTEAIRLLARLRAGESVEDLANIQRDYLSREQEIARASNAIRSENNVFLHSDMVQRTSFQPCTDASTSRYWEDDQISASVFSKGRPPPSGSLLLTQMELEGKLLSSTESDHNLNTFGMGSQEEHAILPASRVSRSLATGTVVHRASSTQIIHQYPSPVSPHKQATSPYYFANPNDNAPFHGVEPFMAEFPDAARDGHKSTISSNEINGPQF